MMLILILFLEFLDLVHSFRQTNQLFNFFESIGFFVCLSEIVSLLSLLSKEFLILSNGHLTQLIF